MVVIQYESRLNPRQHRPRPASDFGCGLRRLLFAPHSDTLDATTQIIVQQALNKWLAGQIDLKAVTVAPPSETGDEAQLSIRIDYALVETRTDKSITVLVF